MIKIILCAYNEEQNLNKLLKNLNSDLKLLQRDFEIIFFLNCKTDKLASVIDKFTKDCKITILPQDNIRGLGRAYKKIFLHLLLNCNDNDLII